MKVSWTLAVLALASLALVGCTDAKAPVASAAEPVSTPAATSPEPDPALVNQAAPAIGVR